MTQPNPEGPKKTESASRSIHFGQSISQSNGESHQRTPFIKGKKRIKISMACQDVFLLTTRTPQWIVVDHCCWDTRYANKAFTWKDFFEGGFSRESPSLITVAMGRNEINASERKKKSVCLALKVNF
ncbi:hypothetical protein TNIN_400761 [Trichonephila inaurata madagascariensis]|uniref:Uncharacterized protein n=1 Tax=Trichonephila inaurata madagascariensis TaxID=2747483 RepID=A0A8X7C6N6_9ARAC|nr:hypothetical protein TNIN_400761 [Trichonephila inaurata madagascariensis]